MHACIHACTDAQARTRGAHVRTYARTARIRTCRDFSSNGTLGGTRSTICARSARTTQPSLATRHAFSPKPCRTRREWLKGKGVGGGGIENGAPSNIVAVSKPSIRNTLIGYRDAESMIPTRISGRFFFLWPSPMWYPQSNRTHVSTHVNTQSEKT